MGTTRGIRPFRRAAAWEDRFWRVLEGAVPSEVRSHLRNARREILLAARTIIDDIAEKAEQRPARTGTRKPKA